MSAKQSQKVALVNKSLPDLFQSMDIHLLWSWSSNNFSHDW